MSPTTSKKLGKNTQEEYSAELGTTKTGTSAERVKKTATVPTGYVYPEINQEAAREFTVDSTVIPTPGVFGGTETTRKAMKRDDDK